MADVSLKFAFIYQSIFPLYPQEYKMLLQSTLVSIVKLLLIAYNIVRQVFLIEENTNQKVITDLWLRYADSPKVDSKCFDSSTEFIDAEVKLC